MFYWSLQYGAYVEVLSPPELRKELAKTICLMNERYNGPLGGNENEAEGNSQNN